jgi:hypothetical protein
VALNLTAAVRGRREWWGHPHRGDERHQAAEDEQGDDEERWRLELLDAAAFVVRRKGVGGRSCSGEARARSSVTFYRPRRRRWAVRGVKMASGGGFQWGRLREEKRWKRKRKGEDGLVVPLRRSAGDGGGRWALMVRRFQALNPHLREGTRWGVGSRRGEVEVGWARQGGAMRFNRQWRRKLTAAGNGPKAEWVGALMGWVQKKIKEKENGNQTGMQGLLGWKEFGCTWKIQILFAILLFSRFVLNSKFNKFKPNTFLSTGKFKYFTTTETWDFWIKIILKLNSKFKLKGI